MDEESELEKVLDGGFSEQIANELNRKSGFIHRWNDWRPYRVDVASGWVYYTSVYAIQEAAATLVLKGTITEGDLKRIAFTRAIGLAAHAVSIRPIGKVRNYFANRWGVTKESSFLDKLKVNLIAVTPIQSVVYAGMLAGGMFFSENYNWKSSLLAWGIGTGLGALHAFPFGYVQDRFRRSFDIQSAFRDKD